MQPLTDPAFLRCKYTSYLLLAGTFLLAFFFLQGTGNMRPASPSASSSPAVYAHPSR